MKNKFTKQNIFFVLVIALILIPQTRQPIQIALHKGLSYINQSTIIDKEDRDAVSFQNWQLISDNGTNLNLPDLKGKVIFINFWATWCPPCIAEMPSLQELYNAYDSDVVFLYITNDELETVQKFKDKNNYTFKVYSPRTPIPQEFLTNSIPRTFIINKKGEIVVDESGAIDWFSEKVKTQISNLIQE